MKTGMCALIAGVLMLSPAHAEPSASEALKDMAKADQSAIPSVFLNGAVAGLTWANSWLDLDGKPRLFCPPDKLALTLEQDISILRHYVEEHPLLKDRPLSAVMLFALQDAFPCKGR
jgi:hypothetical protein